MKTPALAIVAVFASACSVGDLPQATGTRADERDVAGTAEPHDFPAVEGAPTSIEFTISELDWGLFAGVASDPIEATVQLEEGEGWFESELPPGAFSVRGKSSGEVRFDSTSGEWLEAASGEQTDAPFFNPARGQFTFRIVYENGGWSVTAERTSEGEHVPVDAVTPPSEVGAWFDTAFEGGFGELSQAIHANGGPVATERGVLFIAAATEGAPAPFVSASWNDGVPTASTQLRAIAPGIAARFIDVDAGEQHYTIFDPATQTSTYDRTNRFVAHNDDGFTSVFAPEGPRTVRARVDHAEVFVRLPADYDVASRAYPTIYVHDGVSSIAEGGFDEVVDGIGALSPGFESIAVFIAPPQSNLAHAMATEMDDAYFQHVAGSVVPFVEANFRARSDRGARGIAGAGFGGVASYWTAVHHAETFGYTAAISASLSGPEVLALNELAQRGCQNVVYRIAASAVEPGPVATSLRDTLDVLGCDYGYVTDSRRDDWDSYGERFGDALLDFARVHSR